MKILVKRLPTGSPILPVYKTPGSAGMDLFSCREYTILPGDRCLVGTGLVLEIPPGYEGQIRSRSGLAFRHGLIVLNQPGTIDSDYRGEVGVVLTNLGSAPVTLPAGSSVAQIVFAAVERAELVEQSDLSDTDRGEGGFGSTGMVPA